MPIRYDRPPAGGFAANVAGRFLDGLTSKLRRDEEQAREDELLAGKQEREKELIGARTEARISLQEMMNAFQVKRDEAAQAYRTGEAQRAEQADRESDALLEGIKQTGRKELQQMRIGAGAAKASMKPLTPTQQMKEFDALYGDELDINQKRKARGYVANEGLDTAQAVRLVVGEEMAASIVGRDMAPTFQQFNRKSGEKFINGQDLLTVMTEFGLVRQELRGFDVNRIYSAEEAVQVITSAQPDVISFKNDPDAWDEIQDVLNILLEQNYEPGEAPAGKSLIKRDVTQDVVGAIGAVGRGAAKAAPPSIPPTSRQFRR